MVEQDDPTTLVETYHICFTYQHDYIQESGIKVANTTSPLDGRFGVWKDKLIPHLGASKQRTITILCSFFSRRID